MTTLTDSLQTDIKVVSYTTLKALNDTALMKNYNRAFNWKALDKIVSKEHYFPLKQLMLHEYGTEVAARCQVVLNYEGEVGWLDVPLKLFHELINAETFEADMEKEFYDE